MATVAERLKEIMDIKNLRQVDLVRLAEPVGEESGIHLSKSHISQYLSGKSQPRRDILKVMAQALGLLVVYLVCSHDDTQFASCLYSVRLYHTRITHGDVLQVVQTLDVSLHYLPAGTGTGTADGITHLYDGSQQ